MKQLATFDAPAHLRPNTKAWWQSVHRDYDLEEHHSRLLTMACEAWDRACQAREILAKDGIVIAGREAAAGRILLLPSSVTRASPLPGWSPNSASMRNRPWTPA